MAVPAYMTDVSMPRDSVDGGLIQTPATASLVDGAAIAATITTLALTLNVVTVTTGTHGYKVGQRVTVALLTGPTAFADCNGTFVIASVPSGTTFTYAFTHANIVSGAATGTTTAYNLSTMPTATTELALVFPSKAFGLTVVPMDATDASFSFTSGGGIGGTFPLIQNVANFIPGLAGNTVYIQRTTTTKIAFVFQLGT